MITLTLAQKRLNPVRYAAAGFEVAQARAIELNERSLVTLSLLTCLVVSFAVYLTAFYFAFQQSVGIHRNQDTIVELSEDITARELALQQRITALALNDPLPVQSMEKVSTIMYVGPDNVAVVR